MLRKLGEEVLFICGSDTHGTPIIMNAESQGISPKELVDRYHDHFDQIFRGLKIEFDNFGRTDSPTNHHRTREIVSTLIERGYIYPKTIKQAYCSECAKFLPDRYVRGICPYCGSEARGDECDQGCGRHLELGEIESPVCNICGNPAEFRTQEHYFFKLLSFRDFLIEYLNKMGGTSNAKNYALQWTSGLRDWCITRNLEWGVPFPDREDLVVYVWVDAPIGYISFTEELDERRLEEYWKGEGRIIHFIGGDIIYHHCIFWPALLKAAGYNLPTAVVASGMVKIDGRAFSKSRGQAIWVEDYLDRGLHPDLLRYYLISYTSHTKELNFSWKVFREKVNNELVGILGNFVYRTMLFTYKNFGTIPDGEIDPEVMERIKNTEETIKDALDEYEFKKMIDAPMILASFGNSYFQSREPWHTIHSNEDECGRTLKNCLQIIKSLCIFLDPAMPTKMEIVWSQIGMGDDIHRTQLSESHEEIRSGQKITKPTLLFDKIEDEMK
jgi:methionyl-tRNA synthetase